MEVILKKDIVLICCVECFEGTKALDPLRLPTNKTPLRMFCEKVEALNCRYNTAVSTIFIVNPLHEARFDSEIKDYQEAVLDEEDAEKGMTSPPF